MVAPLASLIVVQDQHQPCPYLDGTIARMPLRLPLGAVTPEVTDRLLEMGFRRSGEFVYRTQCPACHACKPTRVDVDQFRPTRSMRRVLRRGQRELQARWGPPSVDSRRLELFNLHRTVRQLTGEGDEVDAISYRSFLVDSCCDTRELTLWLGNTLIAVAIVDIGHTSTSAVYTHFDPAYSRYSPGTLAILYQIEWARQHHRRWVYLGMYVAANRHLNYKARFQPQQRLEGGRWRDRSDWHEASAEPL